MGQMTCFVCSNTVTNNHNLKCSALLFSQVRWDLRPRETPPPKKEQVQFVNKETPNALSATRLARQPRGRCNPASISLFPEAKQDFTNLFPA